VLDEMPKPAKNAPIDPKFVRHLQNTSSNIVAKSHANPISHASILHKSPFLAIDSEPSAQIPFSSPQIKPSAHFTHIYPYKPIREVSAQFQIISCLIFNFKPHVALFHVQTPFSRRLTSRSPYLSIYVPPHLATTRAYSYPQVVRHVGPEDQAVGFNHYDRSCGRIRRQTQSSRAAMAASPRTRVD
jgi:UDP:flavonoid glycosyltransferase YjiC (YdhE family)